MTSTSRPEVTVDYQESDRAVEQPDRIPVVLVAGSGPSPNSELLALLRKRLQFLGLAGTTVLAALTVFLMVSIFQRNSQLADGFGIFVARVIILLPIFGGRTRKTTFIRMLRVSNPV